ncbi:putative quinol monooxygenase [Celeribacter sp.]|uniref:putative quinol monooxygenase n=1 Tax=Celeribacter sp. TaxID=1890673 RepID=UPI003A8FD22B
MSKVLLTGTLTCTPDEVDDVLSVMADHIRKSRAEAGCLQFELWQDELTPTDFHVSEVFLSEAAFATHQDRTQGSDWGRITRDMTRNFKKATA